MTGLWRWCYERPGIVAIGVAVLVTYIIRWWQKRETGEREIVEVCALTLALSEAVFLMKRAGQAAGSHEATGSFIAGILLFYAAARGLKSILISQKPEKVATATIDPASAAEIPNLPSAAPVPTANGPAASPPAVAKEGEKTA